MKYPRHLWTGDWRSESEAVRSARSRERERARATAGPEGGAPEDATPAAEEMPGPAPRRNRTSTIRLGVVLVLAAIAVGVAFAAGAVFGGGGNSSPVAGDAVKPLPATTRKPTKPPHGRTPARTVHRNGNPP